MVIIKNKGVDVFIKFCGMRKIEDAKFAINQGANALGFIAYDKSPRFIDTKTLKWY